MVSVDVKHHVYLLTSAPPPPPPHHGIRLPRRNTNGLRKTVQALDYVCHSGNIGGGGGGGLWSFYALNCTGLQSRCRTNHREAAQKQHWGKLNGFSCDRFLVVVVVIFCFSCLFLCPPSPAVLVKTNYRATHLFPLLFLFFFFFLSFIKCLHKTGFRRLFPSINDPQQSVYEEDKTKRNKTKPHTHTHSLRPEITVMVDWA